MDADPTLLFLGLAMVCLSAYGVYAFLNNKTIERLGLDFELDQGSFGPKRPVTFRVKLNPKEDVVIDSISARIWCQETQEDGSRSRRHPHRTTTSYFGKQWEQNLNLCESLPVKAQDSQVFEGSFEIPYGVKGSKKGAVFISEGGSSLSRTWYLMVSVKTPKALPVQIKREIYVSTL